jgi:hypothetical protein
MACGFNDRIIIALINSSGCLFIHYLIYIQNSMNRKMTYDWFRLQLGCLYENSGYVGIIFGYFEIFMPGIL